MIRKRTAVGWVLMAGCVIAVAGCGGGGAVSTVEGKIDVSAMEPEAAINQAAAAGDLASVKQLVEGEAALLGAKGISDRTPLHFAAANGRADVVKYLLEQGADPAALDENGERPVEAAIQMGHTAVATILKEAVGESGGEAPPAEGQ